MAETTATAAITEPWMQALADACKANKRGKAGVADALGVSRGYVSQIMNNHWPSVPQDFVVRVQERLCQVSCPHLGESIAPSACRQYATRQWEAISQFEVDHWRACQRCPSKAPPAPAALKPKPQDWVFVPHPRRQHGKTATATATPCQGATP